MTWDDHVFIVENWLYGSNSGVKGVEPHWKKHICFLRTAEHVFLPARWSWAADAAWRPAGCWMNRCPELVWWLCQIYNFQGTPPSGSSSSTPWNKSCSQSRCSCLRSPADLEYSETAADLSRIHLIPEPTETPTMSTAVYFGFIKHNTQHNRINNTWVNIVMSIANIVVNQTAIL